MSKSDMKFPAFVPAAVRKHIAEIIERVEDSREIYIQGINDINEYMLRESDEEILNELRKQKLIKERFIENSSSDVACLIRLAKDNRMQHVYAMLTREFTQDYAWDSYIKSAWSARLDYKVLRDRLKKAEELNERISKTSSDLVELLKKTEDSEYIGWPAYFHRVHRLIGGTYKSERNNFNRNTWVKRRNYVFGNYAYNRDEAEMAGQTIPSLNEILSYCLSRSEAREKGCELEVKRNEVIHRAVWNSAPNVSDFLSTLTKKSREFHPTYYGMIGSAINSRKSNTKSEYIRAFGYLLKDDGFVLSANIIRAIAMTANVVLNHPDIDISYDDARKCLSRISEN